MASLTANSETFMDESHEPLVFLEEVSHDFRAPDGRARRVLDSVTLNLWEGTFTTVVGPTGCGKSTILNILGGLVQPTTGKVVARGDVLEEVAYVFQGETLLPWRTACDNVAMPLLVRGRRRREARCLAREWLERVGLREFVDWYPQRMSGGMRKRVQLAQSLIYAPRLLLLDEPFVALDAQTRLSMQDLLLELWQGTGSTVIFVTHDLDEAVALADEVVVMRAGPRSTVKAIQQVELPRPRRVSDLRLTAEFNVLYSKLWESLREEVERAAGGE